jgi:hypothetical protein
MTRATAYALAALALTAAMAGQAEAKARPKKAQPVLVQPPPWPAPVVIAAPAPLPPPPTLRELTSAGETQVRDRLGAPDVARHEDAGAFWTYRYKTCALFIYFRAEDGQPLKVTGASTGPRRRGQAVLPVDACLTQFRDHDTVTDAADPIQAILDQPGATPQP